jgi:hypothetical protein
MFEILKSFSPATAVRRNRSFQYFFERYYLEDPAALPPHPWEPALSKSLLQFSALLL